MAVRKSVTPENALQNLINAETLRFIAKKISAADNKFDETAFKKISKSLTGQPLKARVILITQELKKLLGSDYLSNLILLEKAFIKNNEPGDISGFALWPISYYVEAFGVAHPQESLAFLEKFTPLFTSEFAVRPLLKEHRVAGFKYLLKCSRSLSADVRRWASEGSRPQLPWGGKLVQSISDPYLGLEILENLKDDSSLYVRKSVANHLNDITKTHPELVMKTLSEWLKTASKDSQPRIEWIIKHSLRTQIKAGNPAALKLLGANTKTKFKLIEFKNSKKQIQIGEKLDFNFTIEPDQNGLAVIDYRIHFLRQNGGTGIKVFKLRTVSLEKGIQINFSKKHSFAPITTRTFYPGIHKLEVMINGQVIHTLTFNLKLPSGGTRS